MLPGLIHLANIKNYFNSMILLKINNYFCSIEKNIYKQQLLSSDPMIY